MANLLVYLRYSLFLILAICFAVQASVAAWNLHITQLLVAHSQLDAFLIACGVLGLLIILPVTCIDIVRKNALFARVWFEVAWLAVFFVLEVAGSAALTALLSDMACTARGIERDPACHSTAVLTGFTWATTVTVLFYMTGLIISAILHQEEYRNVWHTGVRDFPWYEASSGSRKLPSSPVRKYLPSDPREDKWIPPVTIPRPVHAPTSQAWHSYRNEPRGRPRTQNAPAPATSRVQPLPSSASFYPKHIESAVSATPASTPSPFTSTRPPQTSTTLVGRSSTSNTPRQSDESVAPPRRQPRGPRHKPPPLDLSKLSSYR